MTYYYDQGWDKVQQENDLADMFFNCMKFGDPEHHSDWMGEHYDRKPKDLSAVFMESLDSPNGPDYADLVRLMSLCMKSSDENVKKSAKELVNRCADVWARMNVD